MTILESHIDGGSYYTLGTDTYVKYGESFQASTTFYLDMVQFDVAGFTGATGDVTVELIACSSHTSTNGTILATSNPIPAAKLIDSTLYRRGFRFTGTNRVKVQAGQYYMVVLCYSGTTSATGVAIGYISAGTYPGSRFRSTTGVSWVFSSSADLTFYIYGMPVGADHKYGGFYREITVNPAGLGGATLDNYAMKYLVGESATSGTHDFHLGGKSTSFPVKGNSGDVIFATTAGEPIGYWTEKVTGTAPNRVATIWMKVPTNMGTSGSPYTFRCYYGKTGATGLDSGHNTFVLFDDWEYFASATPQVDLGIWHASAGSAGDTRSVASSELTLVTDGTSPIKTIQSLLPITTGLSLHYRLRVTTMASHNLGVGLMESDRADGNGQFFFRHVNPGTGAGDINPYQRTTATWTANGTIAPGQWGYAEGATDWEHRLIGSSHSLYKGDTQVGTTLTRALATDKYVIIPRVWDEPTIDTGTFIFDHVFARPRVTTQPTTNSIGVEKSLNSTGNMLMMFN